MRMRFFVFLGCFVSSVSVGAVDTFPACTNDLDAEDLSTPRASPSRSIEDPHYRVSAKEKSVLKGKAAQQAGRKARLVPVVTHEARERQKIYRQRAKVVSDHHEGSSGDLDKKLRTLKLEIFSKTEMR